MKEMYQAFTLPRARTHCSHQSFFSTSMALVWADKPRFRNPHYLPRKVTVVAEKETVEAAGKGAHIVKRVTLESGRAFFKSKLCPLQDMRSV